MCGKLPRPGQPLTGSYSYAGSSSGSITSGGRITLKHGESITITELPAATQYKVTEADYLADGYRMSCTGDTGSISKDKTAVAAFVNTKDQSSPSKPGSDPDPIPPPAPLPGNLTVSKTVYGNAAHKGQAFVFTVTFKNTAGQVLDGDYHYTGSSSGSIASGGTIALKHGESVTITGLPAGTQYEVTEADYSVDGCEMSCTGNAGSILAAKPATAAFSNKYPEYVELTEDDIPLSGIDLPKTGDSGTALWLWLMMLSAAGLSLTLYMERKRRSGQGN